MLHREIAWIGYVRRVRNACQLNNLTHGGAIPLCNGSLLATTRNPSTTAYSWEDDTLDRSYGAVTVYVEGTAKRQDSFDCG